MGALFKRNGIYYADFVDANGERQRKSTGERTYRAARAELRRFELDASDRPPNQAKEPATAPTGAPQASTTETLKDALSYFVNVTHAASPKGTQSFYRQKSRHLTRVLGPVALDELSREKLDRYVALRIEESAHPHSVFKELVALRGCLKAAKQRGKFHGSIEIVPTLDPGYVPRTSYLTPKQFERLVDHLVPLAPPRASIETLAKRDHRLRQRVLYCMLIAFGSPRKGELEAMRWEEHVDLDAGVLRIPKGKTVSRPMKIHPMLRPWLEAMQQDTGPVVAPWANAVRDLEVAANRAGVPKVTPNDLRRTFASWLVQSGESLYVVSRLLGHKSTKMVERVYGQLDDATLSRAVERLPQINAKSPTSHGSQGVTDGGASGNRQVRPKVGREKGAKRIR